MSDAHDIITALMTNQSSTGIDMIKAAIEKRAEAAIQQFVNTVNYGQQEPTPETPQPEATEVETAPNETS